MNKRNRYTDSIISFFQQHRLIIVGVFIGLAILVISIAFSVLHGPELRVSFLDVGQGDAVLIYTPSGRELLVDAGPDQTVVEKLGEEKSFFNRSIDMILATHSDKDHIGGFPYVLDRYHVGTIIESEISSPTTTDRVFGQKTDIEHANKLWARTGERIVLDSKYGVVLDILFPDQNPTGWETNEASIVAKLSYGSTSFLLTGDSPSEVENHLVELYGDQLRADVLKLGHHGSKTSSSDEFLQDVKPSYAIVSAGLGNKYGHPSPEAIERAEAINTEILGTPEHGTIHCISNGHNVVCQGSK